jgi:hypothetical protein
LTFYKNIFLDLFSDMSGEVHNLFLKKSWITARMGRLESGRSSNVKSGSLVFWSKRECTSIIIDGFSTWTLLTFASVNEKIQYLIFLFRGPEITQEGPPKMDPKIPNTRRKFRLHSRWRAQLEEVRPEGHPRRQISKVTRNFLIHIQTLMLHFYFSMYCIYRLLLRCPPPLSTLFYLDG